jgi:hypothetical protein
MEDGGLAGTVLRDSTIWRESWRDSDALSFSNRGSGAMAQSPAARYGLD